MTQSLYSICYVSNVSNNELVKDIEKILSKSRNWNNENGITGVLLFSDGNFFQVLEGERNMVLSLFERIQNDKRHKDIIKIFEKNIDDTNYGTYEIDFFSDETNPNTDATSQYMTHIRTLDVSTRKVLKQLIKAFNHI